MDVSIKFTKSAFKHKITEDDIRWAIDTVKYDGFIENESENKRVLVGFDQKGNLLEIFYNILDKDTVRVFHAMKCRKSFEDMLEKKGKTK